MQSLIVSVKSASILAGVTMIARSSDCPGVTPLPRPTGRRRGNHHQNQTLKRKWKMSPSWTTYSLPSWRIFPASLAPCSPPKVTKLS